MRLFAWLGGIASIIALAVACGQGSTPNVEAIAPPQTELVMRLEARIEFLESENSRIIGLAAKWKNDLNQCSRR